jgi:hypothetical protein
MVVIFGKSQRTKGRAEMIIRMVAIAALGVVTACSSSIPDSNPNANRGVGFGTPNDFAAQRAARDQELETGTASDLDDRAIAADTLNVLNSTSGQSVASTQSAAQPGTQTGEPLAAAGIVTNSPTISDEQSFDAVSSRETIESDRERILRQRQAMQIDAPEALPDRPGGSGPNIVAFALSTSNGVGEPAYNRSGRFNEDRFRRACAEYGSSDQAQAAFLASGGPQRDREGLDPDGDGFACRWDPTPFRNARN